MKTILIGTSVLLLTLLASGAEKMPSPQSSASENRFVVENSRAETTLTLSAADMAALPHVEIVTGKDHRKYSGVALSELLRRVDVEWGGKCSVLLACYVLAEAKDGYCVLFSIPEIDPEQRHKMVILADRCDGKPLSSEDGPYQLIEEDARQAGRCVKQVQKVSLRTAARLRPRHSSRQ